MKDDARQFPMSYGQSQLWYLHQIEPDSSAYHIPYAVRLAGPLDIPALTSSLQEIVNRFEPLRTGFGLIDGEPRQIIHDDVQLALSTDDLESKPANEQQAKILEIVTEASTRPFDLQTELMIRAKLIRLADDDHVLSMVFHHIAVDHISVLRLKREIETLYAAFSKNLPMPEALDEIPFAEHAIRQRRAMEGDKPAEKLAFWSKSLKNRATILPLPTDHARPPFQTFSGSELAFEISAAAVDAARKFGERHDIGLTETLLSAFKALLFRYTNQGDISVGCPFANRQEDDASDAIGNFMNLLPVSSSIDSGMTFLELAKDVQRTYANAELHQDTPFEKIVQCVTGERDPAYSPIVQTWFALQQPPMVLDLDAIETTVLPVHNGGAKLDLSLTLWEEGNSIVGSIEYNRDLFERDTVTRFAGHFNTLLASAVADACVEIGLLPLLTTDETRSILTRWAINPADVPSESVFAQIAAHVSSRGEEIAIESQSGQLTYKQVLEYANGVAAALAARNIAPGSLVAVCRERTPTLIATLLGIWQHRCAYLPLDPGYPDDRLTYMIDDSGAALLICDASESSRFQSIETPVCVAEEIAATTGNTCDPVDGSVDIDPDSSAYVIYTSGSTGRPKGVEIPHRAVRNFLSSMSECPGMTDKDVLAAVTTISFDISVLEIFLPLVVGGKLHLVAREAAADGMLLQTVLTQSGASVFQATPSAYRMMIDAGWNGSKTLKLLCGGEPMPDELASELSTRSSELWNMYGPTETTIWSTVKKIEADEAEITIGRPIANTVVRILDERGQPTPVGVPGELLIGGDGLAIGYLNRPELTGERFVQANAAGDSERLYKTGDRAKWTADGELQHLGRNDRQIKLRGFRIELEEIENVIMEAADGQNVAVTTWNAGSGDTRLVAYLVSASGVALSAMELRKRLRRRLPDFMIPQHFVPLPEMPLTANGKVDRKRLPDPTSVSDTTERPAPETPMEVAVANIWSDVLNRQDISKGDNFFDIGGHSLIAMKAIAAIEIKTGIRISARMIVMQSLAELADHLDNNQALAVTTATSA